MALLVVSAALHRAEADPAPEPKAPDKLLKAKIEAARQTYLVAWKNHKEGFIPVVELVYRWSRRWLEAELEVDDRKTEQIAAYQAHLNRMRDLGKVAYDRFRLRVNTIDEVTAADFYVAEAEIWLARAKSR
jgi:hypothetical protein